MRLDIQKKGFVNACMTIPKPIVDYLKIVEGDTLEVTVQDSEMAVKKRE